jgi:hypothetical protein
MTTAVRIWLHAAHHAAFRVGGWAHVRAAGAEVSGAAGGERHTSAARTDLEAVIAALRGLPAGADVTVHASSPAIAAILAVLASPPQGEDAPTEDLDLWARLLGAGAGRRVRFAGAAQTPGSPAAFAAAWAELARDKAKLGRFSAPIPKVNLSKLKLA